MRTLLTVFVVLLAATPAVFAQSRAFDLTGNVVWLDATGGGTFEDLADPADIDVDADMGYGLAANVFFGDRISVEFAASRIEPETTIRRRAVGGAAAGGNLAIMPVTAVLQFHFAPNGFIDPYIGAGGAYVIYDFSDDATSAIRQVDIDDDIGLAVNAGLGIRLGTRLGLNADVKYIPIESNATAVVVGQNQETVGRFEISPIILSAGLSLRF